MRGDAVGGGGRGGKGGNTKEKPSLNFSKSERKITPLCITFSLFYLLRSLLCFLLGFSRPPLPLTSGYPSYLRWARVPCLPRDEYMGECAFIIVQQSADLGIYLPPVCLPLKP